MGIWVNKSNPQLRVYIEENQVKSYTGNLPNVYEVKNSGEWENTGEPEKIVSDVVVIDTSQAEAKYNALRAAGLNDEDARRISGYA